jgi:hypothetical protein
MRVTVGVVSLLMLAGCSAASGGSGGGEAGAGSVFDAGAGWDSWSPTVDAGLDTATTTPVENLEPFSFFVTSLEAMQRLSGSQDGFGGDLRYGQADGLSGADRICTEIAEYSMPGAGQKGWRAFLSTTAGGPDGGPVHAIDRIGQGPWYDRLGRVVALDLSALLNTRPEGADPDIVDDLPNEYGVPNHAPDPGEGEVDNHDILTGTGDDGRLYGGAESTCSDWTSSVASAGEPRCGHCWPREGGRGGGGEMAHWISALDEAGCAAGVNLLETGGPDPRNPTVGSGGGYGGIYCFALSP